MLRSQNAHVPSNSTIGFMTLPPAIFSGLC
jgi:hypothetical protein